jgi:hypothetical protein
VNTLMPIIQVRLAADAQKRRWERRRSRSNAKTLVIVTLRDGALGRRDPSGLKPRRTRIGSRPTPINPFVAE